jgi:hypothetical protein
MIALTAALLLALLVIAYQQQSFARFMSRERDRTALERASLLQRIQDPMTANAVQAQEGLDVEIPRHHLEFDDDEDFENYQTTVMGN